MVHNSDPGNSPIEWVMFTLSNSVLVRSYHMFMREDCCINRNYFTVRVGNLSPPEANSICYDHGPDAPTIVTSGWYKCKTDLFG